jgi:hypothetical protein
VDQSTPMRADEISRALFLPGSPPPHDQADPDISLPPPFTRRTPGPALERTGQSQA